MRVDVGPHAANPRPNPFHVMGNHFPTGLFLDDSHFVSPHLVFRNYLHEPRS